jgi:hypothetical protein
MYCETMLGREKGVNPVLPGPPHRSFDRPCRGLNATVFNKSLRLAPWATINRPSAPFPTGFDPRHFEQIFSSVWHAFIFCGYAEKMLLSEIAAIECG